MHRSGIESGTMSRADQGPALVQLSRLKIAGKVFFIVFLIVTLRLGQLHLTPSGRLTAEEKLHIGKVDLYQPRGDIVDRNGLVLATDRKVPSIWADPRRVGDTQRLAMVLSARLGMDENSIVESMSQCDKEGNRRKFVWLKRWVMDIPESDLEQIVRSCGLGVQVRHEPLRYYPQGDSAAHLVGFVSRAGKAFEGLELTFDKHLKCVPGKFTARKDSDRQLLESLTVGYVEPKGSEQVQLTLDMDIQHSLERELDKRMVECNSQSSVGMVMDPYTGAILALASRPAFDPNTYDDCPDTLRKNRALLDRFEPGSSFKIVTASAALELGLVTPDTMINCENGFFNPYGHKIKDFHKMGVEPFSKCFEESSNIAIIKVGAMLGPERLDQWIRRFGFGQRTCPDFQYESPGRLRPLKEWKKLSMGSLPMGQEIGATMPQLAKAFAVIANGGYVVEPYFVERAVSRTGEITYQHQQKTPERILTPQTAQTMRQLCHLVVQKGTGKPATIPEYRAGGKTGTAQISRVGAKGYYPDRFTTIFAGFAPISNPRLVAVIVINEPMIKLHYGGYVCGPVFREVVRDALIRMNVPKEPMEGEPGSVSPVSGDLIASAQGAVSETELQEDAIGDEQGDSTTPAEIETPVQTAFVPENDVVSVKTAEIPVLPETPVLEPLDGLELVDRVKDPNESGDALPDLTGLSKRQAIERLAQLGVPWDPRGAGWVVKQDPPAGTPLSQVTLCSLELARRRLDSSQPEEKNGNDPRKVL